MNIHKQAQLVECYMLAGQASMPCFFGTGMQSRDVARQLAKQGQEGTCSGLDNEMAFLCFI